MLRAVRESAKERQKAICNPSTRANLNRDQWEYSNHPNNSDKKCRRKAECCCCTVLVGGGSSGRLSSRSSLGTSAKTRPTELRNRDDNLKKDIRVKLCNALQSRTWGLPPLNATFTFPVASAVMLEQLRTSTSCSFALYPVPESSNVAAAPCDPTLVKAERSLPFCTAMLLVLFAITFI